MYSGLQVQLEKDRNGSQRRTELDVDEWSVTYASLAVERYMSQVCQNNGIKAKTSNIKLISSSSSSIVVNNSIHLKTSRAACANQQHIHFVRVQFNKRSKPGCQRAGLVQEQA